MGVGMPGWIKLHEFGSQVWSAFGSPPMHVGSSLKNKRRWRDVDVRLIMNDDEYVAQGFGDPSKPGDNAKWRAICWAFTELGRVMTGLPIDFQIQAMTHANDAYSGRKDFPRSALGLIPLRTRPRGEYESMQLARELAELDCDCGVPCDCHSWTSIRSRAREALGLPDPYRDNLRAIAAQREEK